MERYISYVVSKPKTVLALLVLITLVLGSGIPKPDLIPTMML